MQDWTEQDEWDRALCDEQDATQAQLEKEAEDMHKDVERRKPKLNPFDSECHIEKWIVPRPSSYALNKLNNLEYVELDYFTTKGCKEAAADNNKLVSHDTLTFIQLGDTVTICPLATMRPSRHIRNDEDLTWEEMLNAKSIMLHFMSKSDTWPILHTRSIAGFFYNIENHLRKAQKNGKKALMLYQSQAQCKWFDALKHNKGFNLKLIQDELLWSLTEQVNDAIQEKDDAIRDRNDAIRDREFEQVCAFHSILTPHQSWQFFPFLFFPCYHLPIHLQPVHLKHHHTIHCSLPSAILFLTPVRCHSILVVTLPLFTANHHSLPFPAIHFFIAMPFPAMPFTAIHCQSPMLCHCCHSLPIAISLLITILPCIMCV